VSVNNSWFCLKVNGNVYNYVGGFVFLGLCINEDGMKMIVQCWDGVPD
jgi:hypothetical protein